MIANVKNVITYILFAVGVSSANAQMIGLDCVSKPSASDGHVWRYNIEYDKASGQGTTYGKTFGGNPLAMPTFVHYESTNTIVFYTTSNYSGDTTKGTINRKTLAFEYGGSTGKCKIVPIKKRSFKEKPKGSAL